MKKSYLLPALMIFALSFLTAPVSAAPASAAAGINAAASTASPLIMVQSKRSKHRAKRNYRRQHYTPGHRYRAAPRGWHRYRARPRDWNRRGCILVGPLWFCP